jgi:uncharacterized protein (DUF362 family)
MNKFKRFLFILAFAMAVTGSAFAADRPIVSVVKGQDIERSVRRAVDLAGGMSGRVKQWDRVIIKVSLDEVKPSGSGLVTNVEVVRAIVKMAKEAGARRITVADGSLKANTWKAFEAAGYNQMAKEEGVILKDLDADYIWRAWLPDGDKYKKYSVATTVLNCEVFINVPVVKLEDETSPSLSLKNLLGIMCDKWAKKRLPKGEKLDELIVDMNLIRQSDLVVIDGTNYGNMIIAGNDPVSADSVALRMLKLDPSKIGYIKLAEGRGLGKSSPSEIEVKSEKL